jgi:hypothetical protein
MVSALLDRSRTSWLLMVGLFLVVAAILVMLHTGNLLPDRDRTGAKREVDRSDSNRSDSIYLYVNSMIFRVGWRVCIAGALLMLVGLLTGV